ncbi:MAG: hypothetical protein GX096_05300 [Clostridiales bacterium]|nr:hypothetical protein [Clostridiales bacterium]
MKRALIAGLILLLSLTFLTTASADIDMQLTTEDGRVTGEVLTYPVADIVPDYVETYTIDMEVPPDFPPFTQARVAQYVPKASIVRAAIEPYMPDAEEYNMKLLINDYPMSLLSTRIHHYSGTGGHWDSYTRHYPENHPKQEEIQQAVQAAKSMLDGIGISYEYPFLNVMRPDEIALDFRTHIDPIRLTDVEGIPTTELVQSQEKAEDYITSLLPEENLTLIHARFLFGGLPCWQSEISKNESGAEGGGYRGGGGMISFYINDRGQLVHANIHYAHEQLRERAFKGEVMGWEQALGAFIQSKVNMKQPPKGWWLEHGEARKADPNTYHIIGMEAGCTYINGWTRPVWIIHTHTQLDLFTYSYIVDAETGECYS